MKTSNKILLSGFLFFLILSASILIYAKSSFLVLKNDLIEGNGKKVERVLLENIESKDLYLARRNNYFLDDNKTGLLIEGDQNICEYYKFDNERGLNVYVEDTLDFSRTMPTNIIYGVDSLTNLKMKVKNQATLNADKKVSIDSLFLEIENNAMVTLDLDVKYLKLVCDDYTKVKLMGNCQNLEVQLSSHADVHVVLLEIDNLEFKMNDNSKFKVGKVKYIKGDLEDSALLSSTVTLDYEFVNRYDYSRIKKPDF